MTESPSRRPRRAALVGVALLTLLAASLLMASRTRVAPGGLGLLRSPLRADRFLAPGTRLVLPFVEHVEPLDPYLVDGTAIHTTAEGARLPLNYAARLRLSFDGASALAARGEGSDLRERLDRGVDRVAGAALAEVSDGAVLALDPEISAALARALTPFGEWVEPPRVDFGGDSPVMLALREERARSRLQELARATGVRLLVVGLDGADWQIAAPLIDAGRLPNLAALRARGAWGNLKSLTPPLSPLLWTSVATGVSPDRHGILDFLVRDPASGQKVPVDSRFRKVRALWNIFTDAGRTSDVVAWWATWPAEHVRGHLVSDRVSYSLFDYDRPEASSGLTHPADYFGEIRPHLVSAEDVGYEDVARFADVSREEFAAARARIATDREQAYRDPINHLTEILAATRNYHRIALDLLRRGPADLTAVYYQGIDEVGHRFMHYAPPRMEGIDEADIRRFGRVVERFYEYNDALIGELLRAASPDTTVIVLSDHGFLNGSDRPRGQTADIEGQPGRWHRPYGILTLSGPTIAPGHLDTTSLLDVYPTVLYLAGLPVPEDAAGRIVEEAITADFRSRWPVQRITTYETTPFRPEPVESAAAIASNDEMLDNLRSLGYIGGVSDAADATRDATADPAAEAAATVTMHVNLAAVLLAAGELERAEREIRLALELVPHYPVARRQWFDLRARQQRWDEAITIADGLLAEDPPPESRFLARVADAWQSAGRADEAIVRFERAVAAGRWRLGAPLARLLLERGQPARAAAAARAVLEHDPLDDTAMAASFRVAREAGRLEDLRPALEVALARNPRSVLHLNWMALVDGAAGRQREAESRLREALELNPDHGASMANLGALLLGAGRGADALPLLERALRIDPGNTEARVNLASALAQHGRLDEAIAEFERVAAGGAGDIGVYNALARAYGERGDLRAAAEWLRRSLAADPAQPQLRELLARVETGAARSSGSR